jgi:bifunctional non-homologous end joining protein LigD
MPSRKPSAGSSRAGQKPGSLTTYQRKRDFERTPEPAGGPPEPTHARELRFVVQRHRASRLHYDLRFEIDGVLASWAVPKGPTLDPKSRRLAVHVEDHPMEYIDFEGVIPGGEYGGGDVIVWDHGTWEPHGTDDPAASVAAGELHAEMHGEKLQGRLVLVRSGDDRSGKEQWLLLHKRDDHAVSGWDPEQHPRSVISGRTNDEVKADPEHLWRSDLPADQAAVRLRPEAGGAVGEAELSALDALGATGTWEVFGQRLRLSDLDRRLAPARRGGPGAVTRRDLVRYAARIAPTVLPHLAGRPVSLHRFPTGMAGRGSWLHRPPASAPQWLPRWTDRDGTAYLLVDEPAVLVWAAGAAALEWVPATAKVDRPDRPTYAVIAVRATRGGSWEDVREMTRLHRAALDHLGLTFATKLDGRGGVDVVVPFDPGPTFGETIAWVTQLSAAVADAEPEVADRTLVTHPVTEPGSAGYVAPYSPVADRGAPVSAPMSWDELDQDTWPDPLSLDEVVERTSRVGDLFATALEGGQSLPRLT